MHLKRYSDKENDLFNALNELNDNFGILMRNQEALNDTVRTHASVLSMLQKLLNEPEVNSRERRPSDGLETVEQLNRLVEELKASVSVQLQQLDSSMKETNRRIDDLTPSVIAEVLKSQLSIL